MFAVDLRDLLGATGWMLNVYINGRRVRTVKRAELIKPVKLNGLASKPLMSSPVPEAINGTAYGDCVTCGRSKPCAVSEK